MAREAERQALRGPFAVETRFTRPRWRRLAVALASVVAGWALREALEAAIGPTALPFITFFPAVACAAWYGGLGAAVFALALSLLVSNWFFSEPLHSFQLHDRVGLVAFAMAASFIVVAIEVMHRARRDLSRARDVLATTLASIGDGVIVTDPSGRVTFLNLEAERLTRWTNAEAHGRALGEVFQIVNERTRARIEDPVERVLRLGVVVGLANHTVLIAKDGSETPIDDSAAPVRQPGEAILGVVMVFRDVRTQRAAEDAKGRLAAIVDSSGDAILSKDLDGTVRSWNAGAERMFGYRAEEIVGRSISLIVPPERADEEARILEGLRRGQATVRLRTVRSTKDGRPLHVSITNSALRDPAGTITGASTILHDMTEVVVAQDALTREKELLATTLASIGDAVIVTDAEGRVTFLNPVAQTLTGWTQEQALAQRLPDVFRIVGEKTREPVENPALRAMREGAIVGLANHTVLISKSGRELPIDDSAAPIHDGRGKVVGSVLVFRDVTDRKRLEEELRNRIAQLDEVDRSKSEFLATLAHELRNPLAPIRNSISLLQLKGPPQPELVLARDVIDRQVRLMSRLLDDLLDVNRLGRQKLELRKEKVALSTVVESALETARPSITSGRHELFVELPREAVVLDADPMRLAQVFANLLNNAAKYMDPGGEIALSARRDGAEIVVSVRDAGIGIDPEALDKIFEMFAQVPLSQERAQGGVGIGLSLAKGLVELHGGTISAHSDGVGKGSIFTVRLPIALGAPLPPGHARGPVTPSAVRRRILIADDVRDNADTLALMLRAMGHDVHVVYDGESAIAAAAELRPEVVLLDIGMPGLDGYETCRRIREHEWGKSMYFIAQTGWGLDVDRSHAEQAGFDRHMLKPVDCAALAVVLAAIPRSRSAT